mgnify:CR=1 FL=1
MNTHKAIGLALLVGGTAAYVVGVYVPYPGRGFSLTAVMVGITLAAIAQSTAGGA